MGKSFVRFCGFNSGLKLPDLGAIFPSGDFKGRIFVSITEGRRSFKYLFSFNFNKNDNVENDIVSRN